MWQVSYETLCSMPSFFMMYSLSWRLWAHTLAFDAERNKVYAFLPQTHRAAVYVDKG